MCTDAWPSALFLLFFLYFLSFHGHTNLHECIYKKAEIDKLRCESGFIVISTFCELKITGQLAYHVQALSYEIKYFRTTADMQEQNTHFHPELKSKLLSSAEQRALSAKTVIYSNSERLKQIIMSFANVSAKDLHPSTVFLRSWGFALQSCTWSQRHTTVLLYFESEKVVTH